LRIAAAAVVLYTRSIFLGSSTYSLTLTKEKRKKGVSIHPEMGTTTEYNGRRAKTKDLHNTTNHPLIAKTMKGKKEQPTPNRTEKKNTHQGR
jgi:hypothetical protein